MHVVLGIAARHHLLDNHHSLKAMIYLFYKDFCDLPLPLIVSPEVFMLAFIIEVLTSPLSPYLLSRGVVTS